MLPRKPFHPDYALWLLGLLLIALALQDVVWFVALRASGAQWPDIAGIVAMGLAFANSALAAIALVWGRVWLLWRGGLAIVLILAAGALGAQAIATDQWRVWGSLMLVHAGAVAAPLVIAWLAGVRVGSRRGSSSSVDTSSRQFTIWELLSLTTVVALLLALARGLQAPPEEPSRLAAFALAMGIVPWACAPIGLSPIPWPWSLLAVAAVCPVAGYLISLTGFPPPEPAPLIAMCGVEGAVLVAICAVVRIAGYELVWPRRR